MTTGMAPGLEVVGDHHTVQTDLLGLDRELDELSGGELLGRSLVADPLRHGDSFTYDPSDRHRGVGELTTQCQPGERSPLLSAFFQHPDGFGNAPPAGLVLLGGLDPEHVSGLVAVGQ
jgi:hypothetical protein